MKQSEDGAQRAGSDPIRIGRRFVVTSPRLDLAIEPGMTPIWIDPGSAFGTGSHPSTQLCLKALERHLKPGDTVLDLGTGTGILAIAAAKIGAGAILALDTDPEAVRVARENVALNGVASTVQVEQGSLTEVRGGHYGTIEAQVVVANILANVIIAFFDLGLSQTVAPNGLLIVSGILQTQTPEIRARLQWNGLELVAQEKNGEWVCVIARRA